MMIRRLAILGSLAAATIAFTAIPAFADDLTEYLEEADEATYSGRRLIGTTWDGIQRMGVVDVEQLGGMTMLSSGRAFMMVGDGKVHAIGSPGAALAYAHESPARVIHRYQVEMGDTAVHLDRASEIMDIVENGRLRMRMIVDVVTHAPLETEVYDDEGNLFRYSTMVEFSASAPGLVDYEDSSEYQMMLPLDEADVPDQAGQYELVDAYGGPADGQQAFFTDGLFTFSLFVIDGRSNLSEITTDGHALTLDGFDYLRVITPAEIWVLWNAPGSTYALVGDLPPDHVKAVLLDLPRPGQRNWFARVWSNLFG